MLLLLNGHYSDSVCDLSSPLLSVLLKADFTGDDESVFMACTHLVVNIHTHFILWNFIFVERRVGKIPARIPQKKNSM